MVLASGDCIIVVIVRATANFNMVACIIIIIMVKELSRNIIIQMSPKGTPNLEQACSAWGAFTDTLPIDKRNPDFEI